MRSLLLLLLVQVIIVDVLASPQRDTTYNPFRVDMHDRHWCVDIRTGFQKRFFVGAGISKTMFLGSPHGVYGYDLYMAANFFPASKSPRENVVGLNAGAMLCGSFGVMGGEVQYMMSKSANDLLFTPRIGIGASMLHITYGYSFSTNKFPIAGISQNSVMLKFNYPFYTKSLVKRENK